MFHRNKLRQTYRQTGCRGDGNEFLTAMVTGTVNVTQAMEFDPPGAAIEIFERWLAEPKTNFDGTVASNLQNRAETNYEACKIALTATDQRVRLSETLSEEGLEAKDNDSWCQRLTSMVPTSVEGAGVETRPLPASPSVVIATAKWLASELRGDPAAAAAFNEFRRGEWEKACRDIVASKSGWFRRSGPWNKALSEARQITGEVAVT